MCTCIVVFPLMVFCDYCRHSRAHGSIMHCKQQRQRVTAFMLHCFFMLWLPARGNDDDDDDDCLRRLPKQFDCIPLKLSHSRRRRRRRRCGRHSSPVGVAVALPPPSSTSSSFVRCMRLHDAWHRQPQPMSTPPTSPHSLSLSLTLSWPLPQPVVAPS